MDNYTARFSRISSLTLTFSRDTTETMHSSNPCFSSPAFRIGQLFIDDILHFRWVQRPGWIKIWGHQGFLRDQGIDQTEHLQETMGFNIKIEIKTSVPWCRVHKILSQEHHSYCRRGFLPALNTSELYLTRSAKTASLSASVYAVPIPWIEHIDDVLAGFRRDLDASNPCRPGFTAKWQI